MKKQFGFITIGLMFGCSLAFLFESDIWYDTKTVIKEIKKVNPLATELIKHERKLNNSRLTVKNKNGSVQDFCLDANARRIIIISECGK